MDYYQLLVMIRWYSGCLFRDILKEGGTVDFPPDIRGTTVGRTKLYGKVVPLYVDTRLIEFDKNEKPGDWPFCELVGSHM